MPDSCSMLAAEVLHWGNAPPSLAERSRMAPAHENWNRLLRRRWLSFTTFKSITEPGVKHLRQLEDQSVYSLRWPDKRFDKLARLWSMGKDSTVLLWLARKAFFGHVPFPLLHVDTSYKIPAMIEYRDRLAREGHLHLGVRP